jgi:hypothetical protein
VQNALVTLLLVAFLLLLTACPNPTNDDDSIAVTGVTLDQAVLSLTEGETAQLTATVDPDTATNPSVTWASSDDAVATVSDTGLVTAVAPGAANVTATTTDGGFTATAAVTVVPAYVGTWYEYHPEDDLFFTLILSETILTATFPSETPDTDTGTISRDGTTITLNGFEHFLDFFNELNFVYSTSSLDTGTVLTLTVLGGPDDGEFVQYYSSQALAAAYAGPIQMSITNVPDGTNNGQAYLYPKEEFDIQRPANFPQFSDWSAFYSFLFSRTGTPDDYWNTAWVEDDNKGVPDGTGTMNLEFNLYTRGYANYHAPQTDDYIILELENSSGSAYLYGILPGDFAIDGTSNTMDYSDFTPITVDS